MKITLALISLIPTAHGRARFTPAIADGQLFLRSNRAVSCIEAGSEKTK